MKRYLIQLTLLTTAVFSLISCEEEIDFQPPSQISEEGFYNNAEELNLALIGTYNSLQTKQNDEWIVTELRSDNTQLSDRNSILSNVPYREIDRFVLNSINIFAESYWRASYKTVGLANNITGNIDVVENDSLAVQYEAEARFLRGHSMFNLVRLYGGIFIVSETIEPQEARDLQRRSVTEVYEFILNDLEFAYNNLPENYDSEQLGRVTKWGAGVEYGKALLTQGSPENKVLSETVLRDVVSSSGNSLLSNYDDVFDPNNELNNEVMFAVRYQSGQLGLGSPFANMFAPLQSEDAVVFGGGSELNAPTQGIVDAYDGSDPRAETNLATTWIDNSGNLNNARFITKYNSDFSNEEDAPNDWIVIRYADALLLLAEAINENTGPTTEAIGYVNDVKVRSGQPPISAVNVPTFFDFKLELEETRRLEFAFENHRWFDLVRNGRAVTVMNEHFATDFQYNDPDEPQFDTPPIQEFQILLPIPQYEIDLNPSVAQNIGY